MSPTEEQILYSSPEAAQIKTVTGWVSRNGQFWGDNEHMARWDGSTHRMCGTCETVIVPRGDVYCASCKAAKHIAEYEALEKKEWTDEPLYLEAADRFFFSIEAVIEYAAGHRTTIDDLRLVICEPVYPGIFDPYEFFQDEMSEDGDGDLSCEILTASEALNAAIKNSPPLSWKPGEFAATFSTLTK
jgi:hypothetical protein